jgi:hypothetical protein
MPVDSIILKTVGDLHKIRSNFLALIAFLESTINLHHMLQLQIFLMKCTKSQNYQLMANVTYCKTETSWSAWLMTVADSWLTDETREALTRHCSVKNKFIDILTRMYLARGLKTKQKNILHHATCQEVFECVSAAADFRCLQQQYREEIFSIVHLNTT